MADMNNQDAQAKQIILGLFKLNEGECEIKRKGSFYAIQPANGKQQLDIDVRVANIDVFNQYHLIFENCMFKRELFFNNQTFLRRIIFKNCIFDASDYPEYSHNVHLTDVTFKDVVEFCGSTFKQGASFSGTTFEKWVNFSGATLQWTDFQHVNFKRGAKFSGTTFRKWVNFQVATFEKRADFSGAKFEEEADISGMELEESEKLSIKLQKGEAIFLNATFKEGADFSESKFKQQALFQKATFGDYTSFNNAEFEGKADFLGSHFEGGAYFTSSSFKQNACFQGVTFHSNANFDHVKFQVGEDCKSESIADFSGVHFKERAFFTKAHFHKMASFSNVTFDHNAYFDETKFEEEANFQQSEFYMNAHFYGTIFKEIPQRDNITMNDIPNFLQIILNGYINLTNTKQLLLSFEQLKSIIDGNDKKEKDELANEFRNTFKNFKNGLIKDNNLIDASQFHKMELYAKELEASYKKEKSAKDWTEKIQLMLYRLTSDHHTDLLLIFNNMLALIVLFGAFVYGLCCFASHDKIKENGIEKTVYYLHSLMTNPFCFECGMGNIIWCEVFSILALCSAFVIAFLLMAAMFSCINTHCKHLGRWFIVVFLANAFILAVKPAIMMPLFGKLIDEGTKVDFPALTSLSFIYVVIMGLLIWSLQKTARKNTIVPN